MPAFPNIAARYRLLLGLACVGIGVYALYPRKVKHREPFDTCPACMAARALDMQIEYSARDYDQKHGSGAR